MMHEGPYHGLNFCQGTIAAMLENPGPEIFDVIRWFGERGKLFNVHFRNIRGRRLDFMETFPDEGDMDMARSLATYRDVGYRYMLMPDHVPRIGGRDPSGVAFAYCYSSRQCAQARTLPRDCSKGLQPLPFGAALHLGEMLWGNRCTPVNPRQFRSRRGAHGVLVQLLARSA